MQHTTEKPNKTVAAMLNSNDSSRKGFISFTPIYTTIANPATKGTNTQYTTVNKYFRHIFFQVGLLLEYWMECLKLDFLQLIIY